MSVVGPRDDVLPPHPEFGNNPLSQEVKLHMVPFSLVKAMTVIINQD